MPKSHAAPLGSAGKRSFYDVIHRYPKSPENVSTKLNRRTLPQVLADNAPNFLFGLSRNQLTSNAITSVNDALAQGSSSAAHLDSNTGTVEQPRLHEEVAGSTSEQAAFRSPLTRQSASAVAPSSTPVAPTPSKALDSTSMHADSSQTQHESEKPYKGWKYSSREEAARAKEDRDQGRYRQRKFFRDLARDPTMTEPRPVRQYKKRLHIPETAEPEEEALARQRARRDTWKASKMQQRGALGSDQRRKFNAKRRVQYWDKNLSVEGEEASGSAASSD